MCHQLLDPLTFNVEPPSSHCDTWSQRLVLRLLRMHRELPITILVDFIFIIIISYISVHRMTK